MDSPAPEIASLTLICAKCRKKQSFGASDQLFAKMQATRKGWKLEPSRAICPRCPK